MNYTEHIVGKEISPPPPTFSTVRDITNFILVVLKAITDDKVTEKMEFVSEVPYDKCESKSITER